MNDVPIIARRRTFDGLTVLAFDDGYVTFGDGRIIARGLEREALRLFMDDVSRYDSVEAKRLASAAKSAVKAYPGSTILARRRMRELVGPPLKANPLSIRDTVYVTTAALTAIAIVYEFTKKKTAAS